MTNNRTVLMLARFTPDSTNISQAKGFKRIGWETIEYDLVGRFKALGSYQARDKEIIEACRLKKPKFVFVSKGADISIECIRAINSLSKTVLWYMDPLDDNWNQALRQKILECDIVICGLTRPFEEAKKLNGNTHFVHEGFDSEVDRPHSLPKKWDTSFIGRPKGARAAYHAAIGFKVINDAFGTEHAQAVSQSRINLNFVVNESGCSDRVYKIMAARGFLLSEEWPGRESDFEADRDLVIFESLADLNRKIRYYLKNPTERQAIALAGFNKVQKYSRSVFAESVIRIVGKRV